MRAQTLKRKHGLDLELTQEGGEGNPQEEGKSSRTGAPGQPGTVTQKTGIAKAITTCFMSFYFLFNLVRQLGNWLHQNEGGN